MTAEQSGIEVNSIGDKMQLEIEVADYGCKSLNISEGEWVARYGRLFAEMYDDKELNIKGKFKSKEIYDGNPEDFYVYIQDELSRRFGEK